MKISVLSDEQGRLIGIAPLHEAQSPSTEQGPQLVGRMVAQGGQYLHELDVSDDFFDDQEQMVRLHETHHIQGGKLEQREG